MIRQYELVDKVLKYNDKADVALLNRAYVFSMKAHGNQRRASGEPYLVHPLEVSAILAELRLDDASIAAGLLHDTLEDTLTTFEEIKSLFGEEVAVLTEGVTKLSRIEFNNKAVEQAENFRKLLLAMSRDIRVLLIKLCDRLHNMRTIDHIKKPEKRQRIAQETMDIYAPLADRIGLYKVKTELEDLAFRQLNPEEYARIESRMTYWREQDNLIERVVDALKDELVEAGIEAEVYGREKTIYSIYRKMVKKNLTFDQLTDIVAYRVVVKNKTRCYEVLGLIHDLYKAIPGRFKDYISAPKPNGYQSLHTAVIGPFGNRMEVQIRTDEMDEIAENGVAAHWLYKQLGGSKEERKAATEGQQYRWLRELVDQIQNTEDPEEFMENAKMDLFQENVFVFSPKGDLITLPAGATPLDFAYFIHSHVGNRCQAAKINGRVMPLRTKLNNGDQVEIITNKAQQPTPAWREFVVTGRARSAINRYLRGQALDEQVKLGKDILDKAVKREQLKISEKDLQKALGSLKANSVDDLYAGIAQGRLFPRQVFDVLFPDRNQPGSVDDEAAAQLPSASIKRKNTASQETAIDGLTPGIAYHIAKCCSPLPGEPIVGIINTGRGITVHAKNCKTLESLSDQPDRWISLNWSETAMAEANQSFQVRLRMTINHQPGALSSVSTAIFNADGNIVDLNIENRAPDAYTLRCDIDVHDINHFQKVLAAVRNLTCVVDAERVQN